MRQIKYIETALRAAAEVTPMPKYPNRSQQQGHSGVAVASIVVGPDGIVQRVEMLQAPDDDIGREVRAALMQWRFRPVTVVGDPTPQQVTGKITFYFVIVSGQGQVENPPI
jgi:TonB family protein